MAYHITELEPSKAFAASGDYEYALVYMLSELILRRTEQLGEINTAECTEARFFSEDRELHIFETEEGLRAVEVSDADDKDQLVKTYCLAGKFRGVGEKLVVKEYLDYDADGQAVVSLTRLCGVE